MKIFNRNELMKFSFYKSNKNSLAIKMIEFDTHLENCTVDIKYEKIRLCKQVNIINNLQTYRDFVYDLVKRKDVMQLYRKFNFVISMKGRDTNMFDLYMNKKGFFFNEIEEKEYFSKENIFFDLKKDSMLHDFDLKNVVNMRMQILSIIKEDYDLIVSNHSPVAKSYNDFINQFNLKSL